MDPNERHRAAIHAAENGQWDEAIEHAKRVPHSWDVWQQFPSVSPRPPNEAVHKILDHLTSNPKAREHSLDSFLFEYGSNLPDHADESTLNRVADLGKDDYYITEAVHSHPNWKPDEKTKNLKSVADFWADYERKVRPAHFATVKSFFTGKPEKIKSHRDEEGSSEEFQHVIQHFPDHAKLIQKKVLEEAMEPGDWPSKPKIKTFRGEPHVKVYRGVGGEYGKKLLERSKGSLNAFHAPVAHLTSWTTDPEMARRFAVSRLDLPEQERQEHGAVIEKWMPIKHVLHSGFYHTVTGQDHPHRHEYELVFGHPEGKIKVTPSQIKKINKDHEEVEKSEKDYPSTSQTSQPGITPTP